MEKQIAERSKSDAEKVTRNSSSMQRKSSLRATLRAGRSPIWKILSDMVAVSPSLIKLRADRSVYKTVAKYVKDDHLRQALSFHSR